MTIPKDIQEKIDEKYPKVSKCDFHTETEYEMVAMSDAAPKLQKAAAFGYTLAASQLEEKEKEIERLKGLLKVQDMRWHNLFYQTTTEMTQKESYDLWEENWKQFKTENNL